MEKIKIAIADDHQLFREGLKMLLNKTSDFEVLAEAADGEELLKVLKEIPVDVVLIDISMPKISGLDILSQYREQFPSVRFIVITMHVDGEYVTKSVKSGAYGYLLKNTDESELKYAIKSVYQGKKHFNQEISSLMVESLADDSSKITKLSRRETEVLALVAEGKTTREIADQLFVSARTVETHRNNIMKKLKAHNTAELIRIAFETKLI